MGGAIAATKCVSQHATRTEEEEEARVVGGRAAREGSSRSERPLRRAAAQAALNRGFADGMMASAHRGRDEVVRIGLARRALQELTVETGPKGDDRSAFLVNRRDVTMPGVVCFSILRMRRCRELAGKLS